MSHRDGENGVVPVGAGRGGVWFALPWFIGLCGLSLLPMAASLGLSLARWPGTSAGEGLAWVGLGNYQEMLGARGPVDPHFRRALANSVSYTLAAVPLNVLVSLGVALLLNARIVGRGLWTTLYMLPYMLGGVATVMVWSWVLNPRMGLVNSVLGGVYAAMDPVVRWLGYAGTSDWPLPGWFYSPVWCKPALVMLHVWLGGGTMLVFLAALGSVPRSLYEAVELDGAGRWSRFRHVTLVHVSPALVFNVVIGLVFAMQSFDEPYLLQDRAQRDGLLFYALYLYQTAFQSPHRMGYASALAWVLFVVIAVMVVPCLWWGKRRAYYAVEN